MGVTVDGVEWDIAIERSTGERRGFMVVKHSDRRERVNDYAPVISQTGELQYASGIWQPWTQDTWVSGLGEERWRRSGAGGFYEAENVETRVPGKVMLQTEASVIDASIATAQPVDFDSQIFMRCTATDIIREYTDGVGWTSGTPAVIIDPTDLEVFGARLYAASAVTHYGWMTTGGTWILGSLDRERLAVWNPGATPSLYGSHGHQIFASADGSTWGTAVDVGDSSSSIKSLEVFEGNLYVGTEAGLFYYDGTDVVQAIDCKNRLWTGNFVDMAEWEGYLYFNILHRIYKYSSSAIVDITPRMYGDLTKETYGYGTPKSIVAGPSAVYVGFDLAENDYPVVLCYNGQGWHPVYKGVSGDTFHGMGYSAELDWLLFNDGATKHRVLPSRTDLPYPLFAASGALITPKFDGGQPQTSKAIKSVVLHTRDCLADERYIVVDYRKDGATAWSNAGTVSSSPREEISLAAIAGAIEVTRDIQFRFTLTTASFGATPVLEHATVNWLPRPDAIWAHIISVRIGSPISL